jgi:transcription elongation factor
VKWYILILIFIVDLSAELILVSNKNINYKEIVNKDNLQLISSNDKINCTIFNTELLKDKSYQAKHFIFKNKAICQKDLKEVIVNKIEYDFGNIVIQRDGKVIGENKEYIRIKNSNGKVEKIYKNGQ